MSTRRTLWDVERGRRRCGLLTTNEASIGRGRGLLASGQGIGRCDDGIGAGGPRRREERRGYQTRND